MPNKKIICLANSRKLNGRCVAGIEIDAPNEWIRPVSGREHGEVSEADRRYEGGGDPALLDIVDIELKDAHPEGHQQENWLIDETIYWEKSGIATLDQLDALVSPVAPLWGGNSTYQGMNDRITPAEAEASSNHAYWERWDYGTIPGTPNPREIPGTRKFREFRGHNTN